ncbi:MAG: hypothetical protein LLG14_11305 [Nocardiaceae bacterium]|nr:hypothetical protein [Nocardiaceae bacterium]
MARRGRLALTLARAILFRRAIRNRSGIPMDSVMWDGTPIEGGWVKTRDLVKPIKHPTKAQFFFPHHPHIEYLIAQSGLDATNVADVADIDAQDTNWGKGEEDDSSD